jgi:tetraacyldisaccharide 4'-kinase
MIVLRYLLFPFAILYDWITAIRNFLYDNGILKSYAFDVPIIVVGNLSVGGTGKTPQIEYLIRLLSPKYKIATLSRGYKRVSKGFVIANENANAAILGDEPFQMHQKFKDITVVVDANRKNGIENILKLSNKPDIILLDDAFQHRRVKADKYILLTAYNDLFCDDFILPTGNLRESKVNAKRADFIIVTKCPETISIEEQDKIKLKINKYTSNTSEIYFSSIEYDDQVFNENFTKKVTEIQDEKKMLLVGIAKPESFINYLKKETDIVMIFADHHHFTEKDCQDIIEKASSRIIITTEKDYVRLKNKNIPNLFYLPIKSNFITNGNKFDEKLLNYVGKSSRNY